MERRLFIRNAGLLCSAMVLNKYTYAHKSDFPVVRVPVASRRFHSQAVEGAIAEFKLKVKDTELTWLFENCFPNTLDTTVFYDTLNGRPDTYVITGDIDAMWLRDSCAQVWPYLTFAAKDEKLRSMIAGVINRQTGCILKDPYANAFYKNEQQVSEWKDDKTDMLPGVHERKWEIDSLCYPIRLAYNYWKITGDTKSFDEKWKGAVSSILKVFKDQQRKTDNGPYHFQRETVKPTDSLPMNGYGFPIKPTGLICSMFRPSDDATIYPFLIPSNFFAALSLRQAAEMVTVMFKDNLLAQKLKALATEVENALRKHAVVKHPVYGNIYAYEVDGFGNYNMMDDANVPGLLSMPYLGLVKHDDAVYVNTRKFVLSGSNPFFYKGKAGEGVGGPHVGAANMIWPLSIICRGLTSTNDAEIKQCIKMLKNSHAQKGFMHESFDKDNPANFTRSWFAWANTLFGEFIWKVYQEKPNLLSV